MLSVSIGAHGIMWIEANRQQFSHCTEVTKPKYNIDCIMIVNFCMNLKGLSYGGVTKAVSTAYPSYGMYFIYYEPSKCHIDIKIKNKNVDEKDS